MKKLPFFKMLSRIEKNFFFFQKFISDSQFEVVHFSATQKKFW